MRWEGHIRAGTELNWEGGTRRHRIAPYAGMGLAKGEMICTILASDKTGCSLDCRESFVRILCESEVPHSRGRRIQMWHKQAVGLDVHPKSQYHLFVQITLLCLFWVVIGADSVSSRANGTEDFFWM